MPAGSFRSVTALGLALLLPAQRASAQPAATPLPSAQPAATPPPPPAAPPRPDCPEQDPTSCGRRHFEAGTAAFERGDYRAAADAFRSAIAQRPHAVIRFNWALSLARLGRPKAAIEQLELVERDPAADRELQARAARERKSAEQALARVSFRLSDPARDRVELDGVTPQAGSREEVTLDPGTHQVRIFSGSSVVLDQELELSPGERVELRVGERSRRIDVVVVPEAAQAPDAAPPSGARGPSPAWFYAGVSATVVVTGFTVWSGVDTRRALSEYERELPSLSQAEADERVREGHARERRTNWLLAGSIACGVGTAVLGIWVVDFGAARQVSVGVAPQQVALAGQF